MPRPKRRYHKRFEPVEDNMERQHPLYSTWAQMLTRCYYEKDVAYVTYGARGIKVCARWWHFKNFVFDMGKKPTPKHSIDRKDNNLGYFKDNCRWATRSDQNLNRGVFKNSTTGYSGVISIKNRFEARLDFEGVRYRLGRFSTEEEAIVARIVALNSIKSGVMPEVPKDTVWCTSTTKIRGITRHRSGGYIVRTTKKGKRIYLGYFKTLEDAIDAKRG